MSEDIECKVTQKSLHKDQKYFRAKHHYTYVEVMRKGTEKNWPNEMESLDDHGQKKIVKRKERVASWFIL